MITLQVSSFNFSYYKTQQKLDVIESRPSEVKNRYDVRKIYWDSDGNLRHGHTDRNRDDEIVQMLQNDSCDEEDMTKLWMIIPSRWIRMWLLFAHIKVAEPPGPINMLILLTQDTKNGGLRVKKTLLPPSTKFGEERPGHYRRITLPAWLALVEMYGVKGPAIAVRGFPYDDISRWRLFRDPKIINVNVLPEPVLPEEEKKEPEPGVLGNMGKALEGLGSLGGLFGSGEKKEEEKKDEKIKK